MQQQPQQQAQQAQQPQQPQQPQAQAQVRQQKPHSIPARVPLVRVRRVLLSVGRHAIVQ